jgi:hypothetical protein
MVSAILPDLPLPELLRFAADEGSLESRKAALRQSARFLRQYLG